MGFPRALEFLLLGLELGYPVLDLGPFGSHGRKPDASKSCGLRRFRSRWFDRAGLLGWFGGLGLRRTRCCGSRGLGRGDTLHKRQRLFDQLVALTHPPLHHAYPKARKHFTAG
jgi:hypothetical protein